jgi:glycosyltransferase involved in cell wall biosynthesis
MPNDTEQPHLPLTMPPGGREAVCAVVPCYNAGDRIRPVVGELLALVDRVIVVDDGSTDGSGVGTGDLGAETILLPVNKGKGHALLRGFVAALRDDAVQCVAVVDSDGQHDPRELPGLYARMLGDKADLVIGCRTFGQAQVPWHNALGNRITSALTSLMLGRRISDTQSGFRLHSRRLSESIVQSLPGGRYETEMEILVKALREGYRVSSSPIRTIYETGNPSSHFDKLHDSWRIYKALFRAVRSQRRQID